MCVGVGGGGGGWGGWGLGGGVHTTCTGLPVPSVSDQETEI